MIYDERAPASPPPPSDVWSALLPAIVCTVRATRAFPNLTDTLYTHTRAAVYDARDFTRRDRANEIGLDHIRSLNWVWCAACTRVHIYICMVACVCDILSLNLEYIGNAWNFTNCRHCLVSGYDYYLHRRTMYIVHTITCMYTDIIFVCMFTPRRCVVQTDVGKLYYRKHGVTKGNQ